MMKPIYSSKQQKLLVDGNQPSNSSEIIGTHFWYRFLLVQGIGWFGGLGIVGGGMVWAQSRTSSDAVLLSQIPETMPKAVPTYRTPEANTENVPVFSRRERARLLQRSRVRNQSRTNSPVASSNSYIDSTDYSLGATTRRRSPSRSYEPPSSVVLTERSTGCQRVVRGGGLAGNCGNGVASTRTRVRRNSIASDSYSISRRQRSRDIARSSQVADRLRTDRSNRLSRSPQSNFQSRSYQLSRVPRATQNNDRVSEYRLSRLPRLAQRDDRVREYGLNRIPRSIQNDDRVSNYRLSRLPRSIQNDDRVSNYRLNRVPHSTQNDDRVNEYRLTRVPRNFQTSRVSRSSQNNRLQRNTVSDRYASANQNTLRARRRSAIVASIGAVNFGSAGVNSRRYPITQNPSIGINGNNEIINDPTIRARSLDYYYKHRNSAESQTALLGNSTLPIVFPLAVPAQITSMFGWRIHPISGDRRFHAGTDLGAPMGTPVIAAQTGRVAMAEYMGGYGLCIVLRHNNDTQETRYAHLSEIFVQPGELVEQGTAIGSVGSTGNSTGPHLHFEVRELTPLGWVAMNPGVQLDYGLAQVGKNFQIGAIAQKFNPTQTYSKPTTSNNGSSDESSTKFLEPNLVPKIPPLQPPIPASELPEIIISAAPSSELPLPEAQANTSQLPEITIPKAAEATSQVPEITLPKAPEATVQVPEITLPKAAEATSQVPEITFPKVSAETTAQLPEITLLPKTSEATVQVPEITLPKASESIFQVPEIKTQITKQFEVPVPKLLSIGTQIQELLLPALQKIKAQPHIGN